MIREVHERPPGLLMTRRVISGLKRIVLAAGSEREVCGMLGAADATGHSRLATAIVSLPNLSRLGGSFAISVEEILEGEARMRASGLHPVAVFHTHPGGSPRPSQRDTRLPWVTGLPSLIVAEQGGSLRMFCYDEVGEIVLA